MKNNLVNIDIFLFHLLSCKIRTKKPPPFDPKAMDSSNKGLASCSSGKKMTKLRRTTKAVKKMRLIVDIYTTALHCTVEDLDRRNGIQNPERIDRDKEAKLVNVDGEKKINDVATTSKSVGIKGSKSSNGETSNSVVAFENKRKKLRNQQNISENKRKKLRNQQNISSDDSSKQPRILMKKKHTTKEENKMELPENLHTISDPSPVKDQAPNLLQLSVSLENFDCKKEVSVDSKTEKGSNSILEEEMHIPGPPGSLLPSLDHDCGNTLSLATSNDLIEKDSSDSFMSAAMSFVLDIHKKPAAVPVLRLMGKDLIVILPENNM
ncbi:uncharacterized protein LOC124932181 [Impatiens glandulifera]|uniref:uncharacterized protein LOC124932181 n=1 Tax=Impatiens glandulifera TaxID=253017 RepID=UPI001FB15FA7|nr:uncharacterized protein LOC124932181 [Impatiens glandulifera]